MSADSFRPSIDAHWLQTVREDLDSDVGVWAAKTSGVGMSKLETIGGYLDMLLADLGHPSRVTYRCDKPDCTHRHLSRDTS